MASTGKTGSKPRKKGRDLSWLTDVAIATGVSALVSAVVSFKVTEHLARRQREEQDRLRGERDSLARLINPTTVPGTTGTPTKESLAHELELMFEEM